MRLVIKPKQATVDLDNAPPRGQACRSPAQMLPPCPLRHPPHSPTMPRPILEQFQHRDGQAGTCPTHNYGKTASVSKCLAQGETEADDCQEAWV